MEKLTFARALAGFAFRLAYDEIPPEVTAIARRHLADSLACALAAREAEAVRAVRSYALGKGGREEATILGTGCRVPAAAAALVNGTMVRCLDANDVFVDSRGGPSGHFSDGTPALLATAERYERSGEELLTCLVASYEMQGALAERVNFWDHGLHAETNVAWTVPLAAARLAGATPEQAVQACGLSVATATVLNTWLRPGAGVPMIKSVATGLALERALAAVELAALGVTATEDAFEEALAGLGPLPGSPLDAQSLESLGVRWTTPRNMIKRFPAQLYTQAAIEAALRLHARGVRAPRLRRLEVHGNRRACAGVQGSPAAFAPDSAETADHSTPYVVAMALLRGRMTPREYEGAPWRAPEVKETMAKIELIREPARDRALELRGSLGVRLVAELEGGRIEEVEVEQPKGHPEAPLTDAELLEKMRDMLEGIAPPDLPSRLLEACLRLSTSADVRRLLESCRNSEPWAVSREPSPPPPPASTGHKSVSRGR
jgi:2-methylcitrate dehydratase